MRTCLLRKQPFESFLCVPRQLTLCLLCLLQGDFLDLEGYEEDCSEVEEGSQLSAARRQLA